MTEPTSEPEPAHVHHGPKYERWERFGPVTTWESPLAFASAAQRVDGVHRVATSAGVVDVLVQNDPLATVDRRGRVLVSLGGRRESAPVVHGPHFAGLGIGERIPVLALADPTLTIHLGVKPAVYTGCSEVDVDGAVTGLLRTVSEVSGRRLLLAGGSASGFAALRLGAQLADRATVLTWGPVTDLVAQPSVGVDTALDLCYPGHGLTVPTRPEGLEQVRAFLESQGVLTRAWQTTQHAEALVLHNVQDHQVDAQVRTYAERLGLVRERDTWRGGRTVLALGSWKGGHTAPPMPALLAAVRAFGDGASPSDVLDTIRREAPGVFSYRAAQSFLDRPAFDVLQAMDASELQVRPMLGAGTATWLVYAYTLRKGTTEVGRRRWGRRADHTFTGEAVTSATTLVCEARDEDGRRARLEVPLVAPRFDPVAWGGPYA